MFISPMLLEKSNDVFNSDKHFVQLKLDGIRLLYSSMNGRKLYTRHNTDITERFPEIVVNVPKGTILDGELIVSDSNGKPDFEAVMSRFMSTKKFKQQNATYCVFDVIYYKGNSVAHLPLYERKLLIGKIVEDSEHIAKVKWLEGNDAAALFSLCQSQELEGVVLKEKSSKYEINKRSSAWKKVINYREEVVYITGYRKKEFGWLIGIDHGGEIRPAGVIEFGPSPDERTAFYSIVDSIKVMENKDYVIIEPDRLQCEVKFRNWTKAGMMRIPTFQRFVV